MPQFAPLNVHSHYSLLSALPKIPELVAYAKKHGLPALALTDNGNLYGALEFYKECKKENIKPILGTHAYLAFRTRSDRQAGVDNRRFRLILLAKDIEGYRNLLKLTTAAHLEGFYYKPRLDRELLSAHRRGLIAIAPALNSDIRFLLESENDEELRARVGWYQDTFGADGFFLEISRHPEIAGHDEAMKRLRKLAAEARAPLLASQEIYYLSPEDKKARETLLRVNSQGEPDREDEESDFSFPTEEKMAERFADLPEALANARRAADSCALTLPLGRWVFPDYKTEGGVSHDDELSRMVLRGMRQRGIAESEEIKSRIAYELKIITDKGYAPYFLVVGDLMRYAHEHGILTTIRGSVAGSLVTFLAGITNVNPLEYKLPFERFLNPERPSPPDIDMDFADNRRDEMIEYAKKKYGEDKVAQIGTFGTMMARGSVRDIARALGFEYSKGDRIAKLIPFGSQGFPMSIDRAMELVPELAHLYKEDPDTRKIIETAKKIEGCARHISVHAAGVVISPAPLTDFVPLQRDPKGGKLITQYDMHAVEDAGLLKFDFLGIKNLSILADAVALAKKLEGATIDIERVPLDDKKTFEMLALGRTGGLFQLNGQGLTRYLKELRPTAIHDINAMVALYRPGPMENIPQYIERKHKPALVRYLDPRLREILADSYGVITYQDDVLLIAVKLAGYSWLAADKLRKAMGKKIPEEMAAQKEKLIAGFRKGGLPQEKAEKLWQLIEPFAAYGFNKCLTGDTKVIDADTGKVKSIKEICEKNEKVRLLALNDRKRLEKRPVSRVAENGVKRIFELKTQTGKKIRGTANHPFLTFSGWKRVEELRAGDRIAIARTLAGSVGKKRRFHEAAVLGYLLSEGNFCHPNGIYFYSAKKSEVKDFLSHALKFKNLKPTIDRSKSATAVYCGQNDQKKGNVLFKWITELGLHGKKATEKFVPPSAFEWEKETLSIFLGKMWQGDGCVSVKNFQSFYATSSEQMAEQVQHLLLRLSVISTVHRKKFRYRGTFKNGWTVNVCHRDNLRAFTDTAGAYLIGKKKNDLDVLLKTTEKLPAVAARGTKDIIPYKIMEMIRAEMKKKNISPKKMSQKTGLAVRLFFSDKRRTGYQREMVKIIGKTLRSEEILAFANSDIYWDKVVGIKEAGKETTYDLTVPPHHNFVANDMIVHNSHAASYGRVAYQTAYMKANFPAIYMAVVLTADSGDVEKIGETVAECKRMGIPVLPPSINESYSGFTVVKKTGEPDKIRFGLMTIKNFGEGVSHSIIEERKQNGAFKTLADFLERVTDRNLNKKSLEALIKSGALDEFGERGAMLASMETLLNYNKESARRPANQDSLFALMTDASTLPALKLAETPPAALEEKLAWEKELLGLYISGHPLDKFRDVLEKRELTIARIKEEFKEGMTVVVGGIIEETRPVITKRNDVMAFLRVADLSGAIEVVAFPRVYQEFKNLFAPERCVVIKGRFSTRNGTPSIIAEKAKELK